MADDFTLGRQLLQLEISHIELFHVIRVNTESRGLDQHFLLEVPILASLAIATPGRLKGLFPIKRTCVDVAFVFEGI